MTGLRQGRGRLGKNTMTFPDVEVNSTDVREKITGQTVPGEINGYRGMFPCFLRGFMSFLFSSDRRALMILVRVSAGSMTASM